MQENSNNVKSDKKSLHAHVEGTDAALRSFCDGNEKSISAWLAKQSDKSDLLVAWLRGIDHLDGKQKKDWAEKISGCLPGAWRGHCERLKARLANLVAHASEYMCIKGVCEIRIKPQTRSAMQNEKNATPIPFSKLMMKTKDKIIIVAGKSGAGKTTSLQRLAWDSCKDFLEQKDDCVPFYLTCDCPLLNQLRHILCKAGRRVKDEDEALDIVSEMPCVFFIDGFDDAGKRKGSLLVELRNLDERSFNRTRIVITTRLDHIPDVAHERLFIPVDIGYKSQVDILTAHGVEDGTSNCIVHRLVKQGSSAIISTPLLLRFVAVMIKIARAKNEELQIPKTIELLIRKIVDEGVIPRIFAKPRVMTGMDLSKDEWGHHVLDGCARLAYEMIVQEELAGYRQNRVVEVFSEYFQSRKFGDKSGSHADKLFAMVKLEALEETPNKTFKFEHDLFRDFFAASYVASHAGNFRSLLKERSGITWDDGMVALLNDRLSDNDKRDLVRCAIETENLQLAGCCLRIFRTPGDGEWKILSAILWDGIGKAVERFMAGESVPGPELLDHVRRICDYKSLFVTDSERYEAIDFILRMLERYRTEYVLTSTYLDHAATAPRDSLKNHGRRIIDLLRNERRGWFCNTYLFIIFAFDKVTWPVLSAETALKVPEVFCSYTSRPMERYMNEDHYVALTQLLGPVLNEDEIAMVDRLRKIDMDARQSNITRGLEKELAIVRERLLRVPELERFGEAGPHLDPPGRRATWPTKEVLSEPLLDERTFGELAQYMKHGLAKGYTRLRECLHEIEANGDAISRQQVRDILKGETVSKSEEK